MKAIKDLIEAASFVLLSAGVISVILSFVLLIIAYAVADFTGAPAATSTPFTVMVCGMAAMMVGLFMTILND